MIYTHIYTSTYDVHVQMILTNNILVHIGYGNNELICIQYMSHSIQQIRHIGNVDIS